MPFLNPPQIRRTFTIDQANAALPLVRSIVDDVMRGDQKVRHLRFRLRFILGGGSELEAMFSREISALEDELRQAEENLNTNLMELQDLGIEPESPSIGLVDFPSHQGGETIFLCWQQGEANISYWHSLTGGFPNRLPIECGADANRDRIGTDALPIQAR